MKLRVVALFALVAACGESTATVAGPHLDLSYQRTPFGGMVPDSATLSLVSQQVGVIGKMTTADPCRVIKGELAVSTGHVQITIRADSDGSSGCAAALARFGYTATVNGLAPGTWLVEVRHLTLGQGDPASVTIQSVVIQ